MGRRKLSDLDKIRQQQIGENLNFWIKKAGLTGTYISEKTNIPLSTISAVRNGNLAFSPERTEKVSKVLGCKPSELDPNYIITKNYKKAEIPIKNQIFSSNLKKLMITNKVTTNKLVLDTGYKASTISAWKRGQALPSENALFALSNYFKLKEPTDLFKENNKGDLTPSQKRIISHIDKQLSLEDEQKIIDYIEALKTIHSATNITKFY